MLEVSPIDLQGRVDHRVRHAVLDGAAVPSPAMASQGSMRALLDQADLDYARYRGLDQLTLGELRQDLSDALADWDSALYRRSPEWAKHVEDRVDELEEELARRERQAGLGR